MCGQSTGPRPGELQGQTKAKSHVKVQCGTRRKNEIPRSNTRVFGNVLGDSIVTPHRARSDCSGGDHMWNCVCGTAVVQDSVGNVPDLFWPGFLSTFWSWWEFTDDKVRWSLLLYPHFVRFKQKKVKGWSHCVAPHSAPGAPHPL